MTIELVEKEYSVECDICGRFCQCSAFVGPKEGKREAREFFISEEWSFNRYGEAACPECAKVLHETMDVTSITMPQIEEMFAEYSPLWKDREKKFWMSPEKMFTDEKKKRV